MRVEPQHVDEVIIPDGHDKNTVLESLTLLGKTSLILVNVAVTEGSLLGSAVCVVDGVSWVAWNLGTRGAVGNTALDPESLDVNKGTAWGSGVGDELSDDGDWLVGVNGEAGAWTIELQVTLAVRVDVASISITLGGVSISNTTAETSALINTHLVARVRSVCVGNGVGLPDIHLVTACTAETFSGVGTVGVSSPALSIGLSVDELEITWALSITVTGSVFGTSLVAWVGSQSSVSLHLGEVQSTVETARKLGDIDSEGELSSQKVEGLVLSLGSSSHKVCTRSNVGASTLSNEVESQRIASGGDTVDTRVVSTIESAVGSANLVAWAESGVPGVTSVAVSGARDRVSPSPVGVEHNGLLGSNTATGGTFADGQLWVDLRSEGSNLLSAGGDKEGGEGKDSGKHLEGRLN